MHTYLYLLLFAAIIESLRKVFDLNIELAITEVALIAPEFIGYPKKTNVVLAEHIFNRNYKTDFYLYSFLNLLNKQKIMF